MTDTPRHADYTPEHLAIDFARSLAAMAGRLEKLERLRTAVIAHRANPSSAHAELELTDALKAAES